MTSETKITSTTAQLQKKANEPFFNKEKQGSFFSKSNKATTSFFIPTTIQSKLTIGQPNDIYEKEADSMADKVGQRLSDKSFTKEKKNSSPFFSKSIKPIQRKCAACEEEEKLQKKEDDDKNLLKYKLQKKSIFESNEPPADDDKNIQRKCSGCVKEEKIQRKPDTSQQSISPNIESSLNSSKGSGFMMPYKTREQLENSFGTDFSTVRLHTDSFSVQMNKDLNAQAFTHGSDIYFNSGKYNANSNAGKHLLAHELTHVVQQGHFIKRKIIQKQRGTPGNLYKKVTDTISFKAAKHAPFSFISRSQELTKLQKSDEKKVREKIQKAIALLNKAKAHIAPGGQEELLDEMLNTFNLITPDHIGILDSNGARIKLGQAVKLFYTFKRPGEMSKPFEYQIRFDVSHETEGAAAGYFHMTGNYGGMIVIKVAEVKSASIESIAKLLVHESVHMFSHLQRTVNERIGSQEATMVPGEKAARILDISSFADYQKNFIAHFNAVRIFLNGLPHRHGKFNELPETIIDDWTRKVVEETIAYVYQERIGIAADKVRTAGSKGAVINFTQGFNPIAFLKDYMTKHWLTEPDDQRAMKTKDGLALLSAMSTDIQALHEAVKAQVGTDKE